MPGSASDPVVLDHYQTIIEVGWPSAIALKVRVYLVSLGNVNAGPGCSPVVATSTFVATGYVTGHKFTYRQPGEDPPESPVVAAYKWRQFTAEERAALAGSANPGRKGTWESMDVGKFEFEDFPPDPHGERVYGPWSKFGGLIQWDTVAEDITKYYLPEQNPENQDIYFNTKESSFRLWPAAVGIGPAPICFAQGLGGAISNPGVEANYASTGSTQYDFTDAEIEFESNRENEEGETIFETYKVNGIQVTPRPRPSIGSPMPEGYAEDVGPATIWLLCRRTGTDSAAVIEEEE